MTVMPECCATARLEGREVEASHRAVCAHREPPGDQEELFPVDPPTRGRERF